MNHGARVVLQQSLAFPFIDDAADFFGDAGEFAALRMFGSGQPMHQTVEAADGGQKTATDSQRCVYQRPHAEQISLSADAGYRPGQHHSERHQKKEAAGQRQEIQNPRPPIAVGCRKEPEVVYRQRDDDGRQQNGREFTQQQGIFVVFEDAPETVFASLPPADIIEPGAGEMTQSKNRQQHQKVGEQQDSQNCHEYPPAHGSPPEE